jgi:hypothetical protein
VPVRVRVRFTGPPTADMTRSNDLGLYQGHLPTRLNDEGRAQAGRLAEVLQKVPFTEASTSDLPRADEVGAAWRRSDSCADAAALDTFNPDCLIGKLYEHCTTTLVVLIFAAEGSAA